MAAHPYPYPLARRGLAELTVVAGVLLAVVALVVAAKARAAARIDEQQIVLTAQQASMARLPRFEADELSALTERRARIRQQLLVFEKLDRARRGVVPVLDAVIRGHMLPPRAGDRHRLWVSSYRESGGYASISGGSIDNADISQRMRELQGNKQLSDVQLCFTKCSSEADSELSFYPFELGMKVDYAL